MQNNLCQKWLAIGITVLFLGLIFGSAVSALAIKNKQIVDMSIGISLNSDGYIDITVEEAWNMLNDLSNGVQIPIDVRTDSEWYGERIDTPYPEDPRHYCLSYLQNENGLQEFISLYNGSEVVLSCKSGGRSVSAANILVNSEFNGTIYNMLGGITSWRGKGFPTKLENESPYQPDEPSGPSTGITEFSYQFSTSTTDTNDDAVKYGWDWNGDSIVDDWTNYYPSTISVNMSHSWTVAGTYTVKVIAEDNVGDQSDFSSALTVMIVVNIPPSAPDIIGPANGKAGDEYEYTLVTTDPDGDDVYYYVDWNDGEFEEWIGAYNSGDQVAVSHTWSEKDTYTIQVKVQDTYGAESNWTTLEVSMPSCLPLVVGSLGFDNNPPNPPRIEGPLSGKIRETYEYQLTLTDPDEGDVMFNLEIDFGEGIEYEDCGCGKSWQNGTVLEVSHQWKNVGDYEITARVQDSYGEWSEWSEPLPISMPRSKDRLINSPHLRLLEQHPHLFLLLQQFLGLR